jgi:GNAT superfamily N-acetyltransferase
MIRIRPAIAAEIDALTAICHRSKAHWGYDRRFMRLSREALTVRPERVETGDVLVAELDNVAAGVASIGPDEDGFEIELFFVDPPAMGHGVGVRLFRALIRHAKKRGIAALSILSDPNAASFYKKMGALQVGTAPSDAVPGRTLPLLRITIT